MFCWRGLCSFFIIYGQTRMGFMLCENMYFLSYYWEDNITLSNIYIIYNNIQVYKITIGHRVLMGLLKILLTEVFKIVHHINENNYRYYSPCLIIIILYIFSWYIKMYTVSYCERRYLYRERSKLEIRLYSEYYYNV